VSKAYTLLSFSGQKALTLFDFAFSGFSRTLWKMAFFSPLSGEGFLFAWLAAAAATERKSLM